jgi:hypothetical protein
VMGVHSDALVFWLGVGMEHHHVQIIGIPYSVCAPLDQSDRNFDEIRWEKSSNWTRGAIGGVHDSAEILISVDNWSARPPAAQQPLCTNVVIIIFIIR